MKQQKQQLNEINTNENKFFQNFFNFNPWRSTFIMIIPTFISVVIFSTYIFFDKLIATQWGAQNIITNYSNVDISVPEALAIINSSTTYAIVSVSIMISFVLLFSIGSSAKLAILRGKNQYEKSSDLMGSNFLFTFFIALGFAASMYFLVPFLIDFQIGKEVDGINSVFRTIIKEEAIWFSRVLVIGSPLLFITNFFFSFFYNEGKAITGMIVIFLSAFINIIFDFVFVIPVNLGMQGTAYATIISWLIIFIVSIVLIFYTNIGFSFIFNNFLFKKELVLEILLFSFSSFLENIGQSILILASTWILNLLPLPIDYPNNFGVPIFIQFYGGVVPWIILMNAIGLGICQGAKFLVAFSYGAKQYQYIWQVIWRVFLIYLFLFLLFLLLVNLIGKYMMNIFVAEMQMVSHFQNNFIYYFLFYPLVIFHFIAFILYQGIDYYKSAIVTSLLKSILCPILFLGLGYFTAITTSNELYFYIIVGFIDLFSALILIPMLTSTFFKTRKDVKKAFRERRSSFAQREFKFLNLNQ